MSICLSAVHVHLPWGQCKSWTLDCGLAGLWTGLWTEILDCGLKIWTEFWTACSQILTEVDMDEEK